MSLTINHNPMAMNAQRNLESHYGDLATSTRRLSSGLRVDTAADDAAGLAVRELMRADIAAMNQGVRNANDGISAIQTADGSLEVIDNKLIRMKELAEQAATGTYTADQREIIDQEFQQMKAEINRIARSTEFNQVKLIDGNLGDDGNPLKIHFGPRNDAAEDYYYVNMGDATARGLGIEDTFLRLAAEERLESIADQLYEAHQTIEGGDEPDNPDEFMEDLEEMQNLLQGIHDDMEKAKEELGEEWTVDHQALMDSVDSAITSLGNALEEYENDKPNWETIADEVEAAFNSVGHHENADRTIDLDGIEAESGAGYRITIGEDTFEYTQSGTDAEAEIAAGLVAAIDADESYSAEVSGSNIIITEGAGNENIELESFGHLTFDESAFGVDGDYVSGGEATLTVTIGGETVTFSGDIEDDSGDGDVTEFLETAFDGESETATINGTDVTVRLEWDTESGFIITANDEDGNAWDIENVEYEVEDDEGDTTFGPTSIYGDAQRPDTDDADIDPALSEYSSDLAGVVNENVPTMYAQSALEEIDAAIEIKDRIRADLGAYQNRLSNTANNLQIMAENLQAAESRISDVDVAQEMTEFTRNQVLSQGATAMLAQANTLPQMAMQLMG